MSVQERYSESICDNVLKCTKSELDEYLTYGLILQQNNEFYDRKLNKLKIEYPSTLNINLSILIDSCIDQSKRCHFKRIFCMSEETYNTFKNLGYIFIKDDVEYYRNLNEDWVVHLIK